MGSSDAAHQLLQYWISRHKSEFDQGATNSFEATLAHSVQNVNTSPGVCSCNVLVTPRLQNNYGTLNGGCMAALACIVAGTALDTISARSGISASNSIDYMSAMPGNAVVEVLAKVSAGIPSCQHYVSWWHAWWHSLLHKGAALVYKAHRTIAWFIGTQIKESH